MTDKLRKYVLPNIPYVFIGWVFLKLGTAYRLAAGAGFGEKLLGLGQTVGAAFADFAPGLAPFDWLVGIVGAVAFRLLIYFKSKNAKKYRRDAEYGSARWGNEKDIKPFVDPKFENNMLLTATERLTMKRFVKCFFELLTQIIVKVRKCKVQRVCVLHFQLAGSGGCFFLMKLYH